MGLRREKMKLFSLKYHAYLRGKRREDVRKRVKGEIKRERKREREREREKEARERDREKGEGGEWRKGDKHRY